MITLIERVEVTQKTIDRWIGEEFNYGTADCGQLVGSHLEAAGFSTPLGKARKYTTELGAKRVMRELGAESMEDFIDQLGFDRIPPASAVVGDIVALPGGDEGNEWTALGVHVGGTKCIAFVAAENEPARVHAGSAEVCTIAWRVV